MHYIFVIYDISVLCGEGELTSCPHSVNKHLTWGWSGQSDGVSCPHSVNKHLTWGWSGQVGRREAKHDQCSCQRAGQLDRHVAGRPQR